MFAVLDASVFIRALVDEDPKADAWITRLDTSKLVVSVPDLLFAEIGHALLGYLKSGRLSPTVARSRLEFVFALPLQVRPMRELVVAALDVALERRLSVYDACYAVLAEVEDAVLVTADRRLAESVRRAELV